jgi:hypothetical protein
MRCYYLQCPRKYPNQYKARCEAYMAANRQVGVQALTLFALFCISRGLTPRLGLGDHIEQNESIGDFSRDKKFELCVVNNQNQDGDNKARQDVGTLLPNATTMAEAAAAVENNIKDLIATSMGVSLGDIDPQKPLFDYGGKFNVTFLLH